MKTMTYSLDIDAPIERVFQCVDDEDLMKQWMDGLVGIEYTSPVSENDPVGTTFIQRLKEGGRVQEYQGEVTAYDKPNLIGVGIFNKAFRVDVVYRLVALSDKQTRLNYECQLTFTSWIAKLMGALFSWMTKNILVKQMRKLKALAEQKAE